MSLVVLWSAYGPCCSVRVVSVPAGRAQVLSDFRFATVFGSIMAKRYKRAMKQLDELSGPWQGRWVQNEYRGTGAATGDERVTIRFASGTLEGEGDDRDGAFLFSGHYNGAQVQFIKAYKRPAWDVAARLLYTGTWNGEFIAGEWRDESARHSRGPFELWPLGDGPDLLSLTELTRRKTLSLAGANYKWCSRREHD